MKMAILMILLSVLNMNCAQVQVKAPKEPIKVDVTMRVDVYQHIEKDIDAIESIVTGGQVGAGKQNMTVSMLDMFMASAYAEGQIDPAIEAAAMSRKERYPNLTSWESKGVVGENKMGLVEVINTGGDSSVKSMVDAENRDRMTIYMLVAEKNGSTLGDVQKLYASRLQKDAPKGTPIEIKSDSSNSYEWIIK